jgi:hypothetical protein
LVNIPNNAKTCKAVDFLQKMVYIKSASIAIQTKLQHTRSGKIREIIMKQKLTCLFVVILLFTLIAPAPAVASPTKWIVPTFSIVSVAPDSTVTIQTYNFPANDTFKVLMGYMGTRGVGGTRVDTISSGGGGSFSATFNIPAGLKGLYQIAIRLQSTTGSGYFAYNWFYNNTTSGTNPYVIGYGGIPTFSISSVVADSKVTIYTYNFPANDSFDVLMNYMHTQGVNGIKVATISSGSGGSFSATFDIPAALQGQYQIAIRLQSNTGSGYFAYNWFYNNTSGTNIGGGTNPGGYIGFPTFSISSVVRNKTVTILTSNLPANDKFDVLMGAMGGRGVNGYYVTSISTGSGGSQTLTFNIPSQLKGSFQIAIRLQSTTGSGFFAYNWFYNTTT